MKGRTDAERGVDLDADMKAVNHSTEEHARVIPFTAPQYTNKRIQ
jgi:hypothetical protein